MRHSRTFSIPSNRFRCDSGCITLSGLCGADPGGRYNQDTPVRNRWRQFRGFFARRVRYKVTRAGVLFAFCILLVGLAAAASANNLLFLIVAAMLATLLVSGFVSRMCLAGLELDFLVPDHVPAGRYVPAKLFVRNQKWPMPSFSIRVEGIPGPDSPSLKSGVYFPLIASRATLEEAVAVRFPRRGTYRQNGFAFSTSFPFGFLEKSARVTLRRETLVYPSLDPHPGFEDILAGIDGEIETHYRGLGRDFYRIRPYEALESAHHIDWKASAHVGAVQVRELAREQERTVEMFLDRDIPPALDAWFDRILVNGCRARLRRRSIRIVDLDDRLDLPGPDGFSRLADRDVLHRALSTLDTDHRIAVVLRYIEDLSPAEIADRTGDREGTVKSRLHYALRQMRAALEAAERMTEGTR